MTDPTPPIRVALADDAVLLREALAAALEASGFRVVGQAEDVPGLLALVTGERPDVARRKAGANYMVTWKAEWMDSEPMQKVVNQALAKAAKRP
jgi:hypothetical protein